MSSDGSLSSARMSGRLFVQTQGGLGNRITGLLSSLVIAETLEVEVIVIWPSHDHCCFEKFSALFEPITLPNVKFQEEGPGPDVCWTDVRHLSADRLRSAMLAGETLYIIAYTVFGFELKGGWEFFEALRARSSLLRPVPEIQALIDRAAAASIAVHVRLGDHFPCHFLTPRWCYRAALDAITTRYPERKIFVCSDDTKEFVDNIEASYPGKIVTSPARLGSLKIRGTLEGSRAAIADLWILAHCPVVISTSLSSFAVTAQNIGGALTYFLSRVPDPNRFRLTQLAWKIQLFVCRDLERDRWEKSGRVKRLRDHLIAPFIVTFANYVSSSRFQDYPGSNRVRQFKTQVESFLSSPETQKRLAAQS